MSNNNLAGFPMLGSRVDSTITYNPRTITYETPLAIPTSATPVYPEITVESGDMFTFSPYPVYADNVSQLIAVVQNTSGGSVSLFSSYQTANNVYYSTSETSSIAAGKYATYYAPGLSNVSAGTVQRLKMYASAGSSLVLVALYMIILPRNICKDMNAVYDLQIDIATSSLIGGTTKSPMGYLFTNGLLQLAVSTSISLAAAATKSTEGFGRCQIYSHDSTYSNNTADPYYVISHYPTRIAYTPIL